MRPVFSVVISVFDSSQSLEAVLCCLESQKYPQENFECVIVDNGQGLNKREVLEWQRFRLKILWVTNRNHSQPGAAKNSGWQSGRGNITVFLGRNARPAPEWLGDYALAFENGKQDVIVGTRCRSEVRPSSREASSQAGIASGIEVSERAARSHAATIPTLEVEANETEFRDACLNHPDSAFCAFSFTTENVAVRTAWLKAVNGFDQSLIGGEDADLGLRLWEAGARIGYTSGAVTHHSAEAAAAVDGFGVNEMDALFYRHPYRLVALLFLWHQSLLAKEPATGDRPARDLHAIAQESDLADVDIEEGCIAMNALWRPPSCESRQVQIASYFSFAFGVSKVQILAYIEEAINKGLYVTRRQGRTYCNLDLTLNWLQSKSLLCEKLHRATHHMWSRRCALVDERESSEGCSITYRVRYEVFLEPMVPTHSRPQMVTNIPLPINNTAQAVKRFISCDPPDLLAHANFELSVISKYPWPQNRADARLSYECECTVQELRTHDSAAIESPDCASPHLVPDPAPIDYDEAEALLLQIRGKRNLDTFDLAREIYYWILNNTIYGGPAYLSDCILDRSNILATGFGNCIDHTRLFIGLCRAASIPARECCGAVLQLHIEASGLEALESRTRGYSPFIHTWAECYIEGKGWIPVELISWLYGERSITKLSVADPSLRAEIIRRTSAFDAYYFGSLDPYRIHAGHSANRLVTSALWADEHGLGVRSRDEVIEHRLTCTIVEEHRFDGNRAPEVRTSRSVSAQ
jgi:transglutaminase-like putative cysteine protease